jgi:hypothetical protein
LAALDPDNFSRQVDLMIGYMVLKDYAAYRRTCQAGVTKYGRSQEPSMSNAIIWQAALIPQAVRNYTELIEIGRKMAGAKSADANQWNTFGAILYRAGHYSSSLTFLKKSIDAQHGKGNAFDWIFTAMARHHLRQPGAQAALARARELAKDPGLSWQFRIELDALFEEAEQELKVPAPR